MKKINVAELLKDCPKGMKLDCPLFDDVEFDHIDKCSKIYPIHCRVKIGENKFTTETFTSYGTYTTDEYAKCAIFPKGKTTWENFHRPFIEGDILHVKGDLLEYTFIYKGPGPKGKWYSHCFLCSDGIFRVAPTWLVNDWEVPRLATNEEKQELFNAIKESHLRWDAKAKSFKILPMFRVGNIVMDNDQYKVIIKDVNTEDECYEYESIIARGIGSIDFKDQEKWKVVPAKFDPRSLAPGDKVLVKYGDVIDWKLDFFSHYKEEGPDHFVCVGGWYDQCIPYKNNEWLRGTDGKCDSYYVTWKEK